MSGRRAGKPKASRPAAAGAAVAAATAAATAASRAAAAVHDRQQTRDLREQLAALAWATQPKHVQQAAIDAHAQRTAIVLLARALDDTLVSTGLLPDDDTAMAVATRLMQHAVRVDDAVRLLYPDAPPNPNPNPTTPDSATTSSSIPTDVPSTTTSPVAALPAVAVGAAAAAAANAASASAAETKVGAAPARFAPTLDAEEDSAMTVAVPTARQLLLPSPSPSGGRYVDVVLRPDVRNGPAAVAAAAPGRLLRWFLDQHYTPADLNDLVPRPLPDPTTSTFTAAAFQYALTWLLRALLCMRVVHRPPPAQAQAQTQAPPTAASTGTGPGPTTTTTTTVVPVDAEAAEEKHGTTTRVLRLDTRCVPCDDDDHHHGAAGADDCRYDSAMCAAAQCTTPFFAHALLDLHPYYGLNVNVGFDDHVAAAAVENGSNPSTTAAAAAAAGAAAADPHDHPPAVWWACAMTPDPALAARLLRRSSDRALNALGRAPSDDRAHGGTTPAPARPLLARVCRGATLELAANPHLDPDACLFARVLLDLCRPDDDTNNAGAADAAAVCRVDGTGVDLFAAVDDAGRTARAQLDAAVAYYDDAARRVGTPHDAEYAHRLRTLRDAVQAAMTRVTAYAAALPALVQAVLSPPSAPAPAPAVVPTGASVAVHVHVPGPVQTIILAYALRRRHDDHKSCV